MLNRVLNKSSRQILIIFLLQILGAGLGFLVQILIARNTEVEIFGQYNIAFSIVTIASTAVCFGSNTLTLRFVSINHLFEGKIRSLIGRVIFFTAINWLLFSTIAIISWGVLGQEFGLNIELYVFLALVVWVLFNSFILTFQNFDRAMGNIVRSIVPVTIIKSILLIIFLYPFALQGYLELKKILTSYVLTFASIIAIYLFWSRRHINIGEVLKNKRIKYVVVLKNSYQYFINQIGQGLLKGLDVIVIAIFLTSFEAGIYSAANRINIFVLFGLAALNLVYSPMIASHYKKKEITQLNDKLRSSNKIIFLFSLLITLILVVFGGYILKLFGNQYSDGYTVLILLSVRNLVESLFGITGSVLNMTGNQKMFNRILLIVIFVYACLSPIFSIYFGIVGVALLIVLVTIIKNVLQWRYIYFHLNIKSGIFSNLCDLFIKTKPN